MLLKQLVTMVFYMLQAIGSKTQVAIIVKAVLALESTWLERS